MFVSWKLSQVIVTVEALWSWREMFDACYARQLSIIATTHWNHTRSYVSNPRETNLGGVLKRSSRACHFSLMLMPDMSINCMLRRSVICGCCAAWALHLLISRYGKRIPVYTYSYKYIDAIAVGQVLLLAYKSHKGEREKGREREREREEKKRREQARGTEYKEMWRARGQWPPLARPVFLSLSLSSSLSRIILFRNTHLWFVCTNVLHVYPHSAYYTRMLCNIIVHSGYNIRGWWHLIKKNISIYSAVCGIPTWSTKSYKTRATNALIDNHQI